MSKISLTILFIVIGGILTGMYLEVPYLKGAPGALLVVALVYSFVVAKREAGLMALALEQRMEQKDVRFREEVIVPEWLKAPEGDIPVEPRRQRAAS